MTDVSDIFLDALGSEPPRPRTAGGNFRADTELQLPRRPKPPQELIDRVLRWKFGSKPLEHQVVNVAALLANPRWGIWDEQGLGKTATVAYRLALGFAFEHFRGPVLIACPKAVVPVWPEELRLHGEIDDAVAITGPVKKRMEGWQKVADGRCRVAITNYETLASCMPSKANAPKVKRNARSDEGRLINSIPWDLVGCDEVHRIKNSGAQAHRGIRFASKNARFRYALSGTPSPNGPLDIFGAMSFLDTKIVGTDNKLAFEKRHAVYGPETNTGKRLIVAYRELEKLEAQVASCSSRVRKEDALDLPTKTVQVVPVTLPASQMRVYKELKREAIARLTEGGATVTAQHILTESGKLLQIVGGWVRNDDGEVHAFKPNGKLDALSDLIEDLGREPCVIWTAYRTENEAITRMLGERATAYHGGMGDRARAESLHAFKSGKRQFFVATSAAREGLTLTIASQAIFYSRTYDLLNWLQAQDRIHRISQTKKVTIRCLQAVGTVDYAVAKSLETKTDLQELILRGSIAELL